MRLDSLLPEVTTFYIYLGLYLNLTFLLLNDYSDSDSTHLCSIKKARDSSSILFIKELI